MRLAVTRLGWVPAAALGAAACFSAAVIMAGFLAPVYESTVVSSSGPATQVSETLVGQNGTGVAVVLVVPLLLTLAVGAALWEADRRPAMRLAWTLTGLLAAGNLLAMLSIGVFVLPVTAALVVACAGRDRQRAAGPRADDGPVPA